MADTAEGMLDEAMSRSRGAADQAAERNRVPEGRTAMGTSAMGGLLNGIVEGYKMRQQMLNTKFNQQQELNKAAIENQNSSIQDVMNRQAIQQYARPVNNGTVMDAPAMASTPDTMSRQTTGGYTPDEDTPLDQVTDLPQTRTTITPGNPGSAPVMRKADPARTVTYSDRQGNKQQYELKTPQEQQDDADAAAQAKFRATALPVTLENGQEVYIQPKDLAAYMHQTGQNKMVAAPQAAQDAGLAGPMVREADMPQVVRSAASVKNNATTNQTRSENNQRTTDASQANNSNSNYFRDKIAQMQDKTKRDVDAANNQTKTTVAANNQTAISTRAGNRLTAAQTAQQQKSLAAVQKQEDDIKAARVQLKADIADPKTPDLAKKTKTGQLATTTYQLQSYQTRKANIMGAQTPPKAFSDTVKEGQTANSPDGHLWKKEDGIMLLVQ